MVFSKLVDCYIVRFGQGQELQVEPYEMLGVKSPRRGRCDSGPCRLPGAPSPRSFGSSESARSGAQDDAWRRLYIGSATEVEIDSASRVLIPPELRAWAGLEKDVKFMGMGAHFELWDLARYEEREQAAIAMGRPEPLRNLVIR